MWLPSFGDVAKFVEIAGKVYKYGFTKSQRAPLLYNEFGAQMKYLAANLEDLQTILEAISENGIPQPINSTNLESFREIIGDYERTLQDCENFLKDKARFSWQGDFVNNMIWNFTIASDVQNLKDRVTLLNIKLLTILKTLDLRMAHQLHIDVFRIHRDLAARIDGARDDIIQQFQALRSDIWEFLTKGTAVASGSVQVALFDIPTSLEGLFEQQIQGLSIMTGQFPMVRGLDAVAYHIIAANSIAADNKESKRERQWLEVAKGFWIVSKVKTGQEYKTACTFRAANNFERQMNTMGITIASYVKGLEIELLEVVKDSDLNTFTPDPEVILDTFRQNPLIWLEFKDVIAPTPTWELEFSENIMSAPLKGPYRNFDQSLHLFKLTEVNLKLVITDTPQNIARNNERTNNIINVDMRRSRYIPLYATSTSSGALNITFQGDRLASGSTALVFNKRLDLFKFQHAITGYQVVLESIDIQVVTYSAGRLFGGDKEEKSGRLQLWRAKQLKNSTVDGSSSSPGSSTSQSTLGTSPPITTSDGSPPSSRVSVFSSPSKAFSSIRRESTATTISSFSPGRRDSTFTTTSALSIAQTRLKSPTSTFQASIVDKEGNVGLVLDKPENSMLVLFLQQDGKPSKSFSFLGLEIDENIYIEPAACDCRKPGNSCLRIVLQRSGGSPLLSHRFQAGTELDDWNLASLSKAQQKFLPEPKGRLLWVAVDFATLQHKTRFEELFNQLKTLLVKQKSGYHKDLKNLQI